MNITKLTSARPADGGTSRRLCAFLSASLCLHAGLLLAWKSAGPDVAGEGAAALSIDLVLVEPPVSEPAPAAEHRSLARYAPGRSARRVEVEPPPRPVPRARLPSSEPAALPAARLRAARPSAPSSAESEDLAADTARATDNARTNMRARVRALLLADLARYFEYPYLARRRGWQGMVLLSVTVTPNGMLERVYVSQSSGYEVLDRSAVDTMRTVGRLAHAEHWLRGPGLELLLPIVYRLTD